MRAHPVGAAAAALALAALLGAAPSLARLPADAPPLPAPDPQVFEIIEVDTAQELADACWNLESNQAIVIAAGVYDLGGVSFPNGVDGRLTVGRFGAAPIANIQIRGATGNPEDVVLLGRGMLDTTVPFGIQIFTATDVVIADLSVGDVYYHAVAIQADQGATRVALHDLRLFDAGQQIVKSSSGGGTGAEDVIIEYCEIFYTAGAIVHPEGSPPNSCYTNGIDALGAVRWIVRDNLLRDLNCQNGALAGPAVLFWQGSSDSIVERNTFLDSSRGVYFGFSDGDHTGGVIRDNFFRWDSAASYVVDIAIHTTSPGSDVLHNTILTNATYQPTGGPIAIEVRWGTTTGVRVLNNLADGGVWLRDGASPTLAGNLDSAMAGWFADPANGDLHLLGSATGAIDQVDRLSDATDDFDTDPRPAGSGLTDVGADELGQVSIFSDGFESGDVSAWSLSAP